MNDDLLHEVLVASRYAFVPLPDTQVIERPGWMQLVTPSLHAGGMNEVSLAVIEPERADVVIDRTLAEYRERGIRFRWTVGPDSRPLDLVERLRARGMTAKVAIGMARRVDGLDFAPDPEVSVELVDDEGRLDAFTSVMARGWDTAPGPLLAFHRRILEVAGERAPLVLVRDRGEPAGGAAVFMLPGSALLMGAVVLPEHRGRGLYRALVASRAQLAARRGLARVTSHAYESTSAPILARLGFAEVCRMTVLSDP